MQKYWIGGAAILLLAAMVLYGNFHSASQTSTNSFDIQLASAASALQFKEMHRSSAYTFYCASRRAAEPECDLYAAAPGAGVDDVQPLGILMTNRSEEEGLLPSADGTKLYIILEGEALIVDTHTLAQKVIASAPEELAFGVYDGASRFVPQGKWVDATTVELSVYPAATKRASGAAPQQVARIDINK